jgi:hypothetical protein
MKTCDALPPTSSRVFPSLRSEQLSKEILRGGKEDPIKVEKRPEIQGLMVEPMTRSGSSAAGAAKVCVCVCVCINTESSRAAKCPSARTHTRTLDTHQATIRSRSPV